MAEAIILLSIMLVAVFAPLWLGWAEGITYLLQYRLQSRRRPRPVSDDDWNDQNPPKSLNYNYIDWLERDLKVGKYDPDRIALGFDDTEPKPKPDAVEVNERCPCVACRSKRRDASRVDTEYLGRVAKARPVDDSWADVDVRDGVYGPKTGGLLRRIVDNHGNWTEIRSFGG